MDVGASGTKSMAWSLHRQSGNCSEASSEKTFSRSWYCLGTSSSQFLFFFSVAASASCCATVVFLKRDLIQELSLIVPFNSTVPSMVPFVQSILGFAPSKKGYPRMMSSSPMSVIRNLWQVSFPWYLTLKVIVCVTAPALFRVPLMFLTFLGFTRGFFFNLASFISLGWMNDSMALHQVDQTT